MKDIHKCKLPLWQPKLWNSLNDLPILEKTNCFSYAFNFIEYREKRLQPGEISSNIVTEYTCDKILNKLRKDYPDIRISNKEEEFIDCSRYKIALFIDKSSDNKDYHFYRQDSNGLWSHKPGILDVSNKDASKKVIKNPEQADRDYTKFDDITDYDNHNYSEFCYYLSYPIKDGPIIRNI